MAGKEREDQSYRDICNSIDTELQSIKARVFASSLTELFNALGIIEEQAIKIGYNVGVVETYKMYGWVLWTLASTNDEVIQWYEKAQAYSLEHGYQRGYASSKFYATKAKFALGIGRTEWLITLFEVLEIACKEKDRQLELNALALLSSVFGTLGEVPRGYGIFKEALVLAEEIGDPEEILRTIVQGASSLQAPALFEDHLRRAYQLSKLEHITPYYRALALMKYAFVPEYIEKDRAAADKVIAELRAIMPSLSLPKQGEFHAMIGSFYIERGQEKEAEERAVDDLEKAIALHATPYGVLYAYTELGRIYARTNPEKALSYFTHALQYAKQYQDLYQAPRIHKHLAEFYRSRGDLENASREFALYEQITEESREIGVKQTREYAEIILRFDKAEEEKKRLTQEVEVKSTALSEKSMLLAKQTEFMANFRGELRSILRRVETQDPAINDIRKKLQELPEAVNWREFDEQFQSVHPEFLTQLEGKYPDLTKSERKLCVLLRLNLTSRDVSKLLSLSLRTIEHHRSSIRKKLQLDPDDDIARVLGQI